MDGEEQAIEKIVEPLSNVLIDVQIEAFLHEVDLWLQVTDMIHESQYDRFRDRGLV